MKEVPFGTKIDKAEFVFSREFMMMEHNYLCACCKEKPAVNDCNTGVLQPCWDCQKNWKVIRLNWFDRLLGRAR